MEKEHCTGKTVQFYMKVILLMINLKEMVKKFMIMVIIILVNFRMDISMEKEKEYYIIKMVPLYIKEILLMF